MTQDDGRTPAERLVSRDLDEREGIGKPLSRRSRQTQRTVEDYLKAGNKPRWMQRITDIDRGIARERRRIEHAHRLLSEECGDDPERFARRWRERAQQLRFDELNALIEQHNAWYPIERDLPMDPRTRDYVKVHGRSYRRHPLGPQWVLEQFPPVPRRG